MLNYIMYFINIGFIMSYIYNSIIYNVVITMCPYYLELTHLCSNELLYTSRRNQESFVLIFRNKNVNKKHRHKDIKRDNWHILFS